MLRHSALLVSLMAIGASCAAQGRVAPPPLPPGSNLVRIDAGLSEPERKRQARAHHHKSHYRKDHTRDDTMDNLPADTDRGPSKVHDKASKK